MKSLVAALLFIVLITPASAESLPTCVDPDVLKSIRDAMLPKVVDAVRQQAAERIKSIDAEYAQEGEDLRKMRDRIANQPHGLPNQQYGDWRKEETYESWKDDVDKYNKWADNHQPEKSLLLREKNSKIALIDAMSHLDFSIIHIRENEATDDTRECDAHIAWSGMTDATARAVGDVTNAAPWDSESVQIKKRNSLCYNSITYRIERFLDDSRPSVSWRCDPESVNRSSADLLVK